MSKKKLNSKKQDLSALETNQTAEVAWLSNQWQEHPVVGMTPQRLHRMLTEAEQGNLQAQADLFCDMEERDGHIFSEMDKRKKGVNGLSWMVNPPKNANETERKIAEEVTEWIDEIEDLEMFLFDCMDAVGHGYSCQEIQWQQIGNLWLPKNFAHVVPRNFLTPYNKPNELRLNDGGIEGAEFWDFGWVVHRHKAKSGYIARSGLHRVLAWPFLFKNYGIRDVMEFLETYGLPNKIGKYPSGATDQEKMTLLRAVMMIGRNAGGIIPHGMSIDFESATDGDTKNHMDLVKWCEQTQSKVIVGGTLLSQADGKSSTNAQSKTHEVQFDKLVKSDALQLARTMNDSLVSYLMRLNYPNITPDRYPKFKFDTTDTEDIETFGEALPKLVSVGMKIPRTWAHEKLGIPEPGDDEDVLSVAAPQPLQAANFQYSGQVTPTLAALNQNAVMPMHPAEATAIRSQALLDEQMQLRLSNEHLQSQAESLLPQIIQKLTQANDIDGALAMLAEMSPDQDIEGLQADLEKLIFASDVLGRLSVYEGRKRG
ncbi:phage gp29-like protein [Acinetobacter calcoaceticus]|uniref:Phage gp29-like protein n=1 Tax=Acinetobacter calcoaceticus TaxID=471 RepID=A0A4R1XDU2_ACICA|nr:phage gp29-like protein [Acinetobacter calcoaceticus]